MLSGVLNSLMIGFQSLSSHSQNLHLGEHHFLLNYVENEYDLRRCDYLKKSTELEVHVLAYYTSQKINLLTYVRLIYE